jgi:hypothetical protein
MWPTVLWSTLVNSGLLPKSLATFRLEALAHVPVSVPQVPRSHFRLRLVSRSCLTDRCLGTAPTGNSMTTGSMRLGF